jgi:predicted lipoprotein with Yx(FWY)xxD motif
VRKTTYSFALLAAIAGLVIAGCGGGGSSSSKAGSGGEGGGAMAAGNTGGGTVKTAEIEGLGDVLVDAEGMTLYEYTPDEGTTSNCYGECASFWPPLMAKGNPTGGEGVMSSALGTTERKEGTMQVTYHGHPLYTFAEDKEPGEANGNEFEGIWFVLNQAGAPVKGQPTGSGGAEESGGGGAAGY